MVPGRFNRSEINGLEFILDYGHNLGAMTALGDAVTALDKRKTVLVFTLPGDRRDDALRETVQATLAFADEYVLYDNYSRRGRTTMEMPELLRAALPPDVPVQSVPDIHAAIDGAWRRVQPGDRLIVIAEEVADALDVLEAHMERVADDTACSIPVSAEVGVRS